MTEPQKHDSARSEMSGQEVPLWQPYPDNRLCVAATSGLIARLWILGIALIIANISTVWVEIPAVYWWLAVFAVCLLTDFSLCIASLWRARYALTDGALYTRDGWLRQTFSFTPLQKILHVSESQGPLQRVYGLSTLHIHCGTPSLEITLNGITTSDAQHIMQQIRKRSLGGHEWS